MVYYRSTTVAPTLLRCSRRRARPTWRVATVAAGRGATHAAESALEHRSAACAAGSSDIHGSAHSETARDATPIDSALAPGAEDWWCLRPLGALRPACPTRVRRVSAFLDGIVTVLQRSAAYVS